MRNRWNSALLVTASAAWLAAGIPARAQWANPPDEAGNAGFFPGGTVAPSRIESVDPVSGNLGVAIPLARLPNGPGGFGFDLGLVYNSAIFDLGYRVNLTNQQAVLTQSTHGGGWNYSHEYMLWSQPRAAGVGSCSGYGDWYKTYLRMPDGNHLLRLVAPLKPDNSGPQYSSNGAESFYGVDFSGHASTRCGSSYQDFTGTLVYATVDGSYIRVEANTSAQTWKAFLADGTVISGSISRIESEATDSGVDQIADRNGNTVTITRARAENQDWIEIIADGQGRKILIQREAHADQMSTWNDTIYWWGVNGALTTTVNWTRFTSGLNYACSSDIPAWVCSPPPVAVASSIVLPAPASGAVPARYDFGYLDASHSFGELHGLTFCTVGGTDSSCHEKYKIAYTYQYDGGTRPFGTARNPITTRTLSYVELRDATTFPSSISGTNVRTELTQYSFPNPTSRFGQAGGTVTVTHPDSSQTKFYSANPCGATPADFCAPVVFRTDAPDGGVTETVWASNAAPVGTPAGSFFNSYASDQLVTPAGSAVSVASHVVRDVNGNATASTEYDWFPHTTQTTAITSSPTATALRSTTSSYYAASSNPEYWKISGPAFLRAGKSTAIRIGGTTGTVAAAAQYAYDSPLATANLLYRYDWDSTKAATYPGDPSGDTLTFSSGNAIVTSWEHATNGNVINVTDPRNIVTHTEYDASSCPTGSVVAKDRSEKRTSAFTSYTYTFVNPLDQSDPDNGLTRSTCVLHTVTDSDNDVTTTLKYDNLGRRTEIEEKDNSTGGVSRKSTTDYDDENARVTVQQDQNESQTLDFSSYYDGLGRLRYSVDPAGNKVQKAYRVLASEGYYELESNPYSGPEPDGWTLTQRYPSGNYVFVQNFHGAALPSPWATTGKNTNYAGSLLTKVNQTDAEDPAFCTGPVTQAFDAANKRHEYCADALGRMGKLKDPTGNVVAYSYDALDNLTFVGQGSRAFSYTSLGRLQCASNPENSSASCATTPLPTSGVDRYAYDDNGNLTSHTNARGVTVSYSLYDGLNRPSGKSYAGITTPAVTYGYDHSGDYKGALYSVSIGSGDSLYETVYEHDKFGRIKKSTQRTSGWSADLSFGYEYYLSDQLKSITYPSGRQVSYGVGAGGQVTSVAGVMGAQATAYATGIAYTAFGALSSLPLNNGALTESYTWNSRLQQTGVSLGATAGSNLLSLKFYRCDDGQDFCGSNVGNILRQTISTAGTTRAVQEYRYDDLYRLTDAAEKAGSTGFAPDCPDAGNVWCRKYGYDAPGNLATTVRYPFASSWNTTFDSTTNRTNETGWTYDAAGNITQANTGDAMAFDAENRLIGFSNPTFGNVVYVYDGEGRRVKRVANGGAVTVYAYDAFGNLAAEYGDAVPVATGTQYVMVDNLGSTRLVVDAAGNLERHDYLPFGEETQDGWRSGVAGYGADTVRQKFTGQERDTFANGVPTGLDYFNARYYSSAQGRFISVDPENAGASLWDPQSWNGYAYVSNNPLAFTDPTGEGIFGDIGFAIGSFIPGVGRLLGWGIGSIADLATGQSISLPGFGIGSAVFGSIAGSMNNGQPWNEQLPSGVGSIGELNTGTVFGSGNVGGMVFSFTDAACNVGYAVDFVKAHAGDAAEVAARLRVPTQNVLGLSAAESRWGLDWNATRTADNGQPARNFFSLQGNAKSPFANGSVLSGKGTRLSAFPSYKAAAQSFEAQYGGLVTGKVTPLDFATALVPRFNSGKAPLGNPNFIRDLVRTIGMTQRRMGCR